MQEDFLQYLWKYGLFPADQLFTSTHDGVEILASGQFNNNAGPDFLFARIRIGPTVWVGHVEIHVRASDWFRHGHDKDPAYDPVILHVVYEADCEVLRSNGSTVPVIRLPVKSSYLDNYHRILSTLSPVPCETGWKKLEPLEVENWLIAMGIERMEVKSVEISGRLSDNRGGWEETLLQLLFRSFGFGINQEAFDRLGKSIPQQTLRFAGSNLLRMEALLFGQSGMIPDRKTDVYTRALAAEYIFLRRKYNLIPVFNPGWKFLRMRPSNFPTVRMAQLAAFLAGNPDRLGLVTRCAGMIEPGAFSYPVSSYWKIHYDFEKKWSGKYPDIGQETINLFRINAAIPFSACYASRHGDLTAREKWMEMLERLPAESNRVTRVWTGYGYRVPNAFYSQAFLHLYSVYCHPRKCLSCRIGQYLIRNPEG
jgi:hypothetical protein